MNGLPPAFMVLLDHIRTGGLERRAWLAIEVAGVGPDEFDAQIPAMISELGPAGPTQRELEDLAQLTREAIDDQAPRIPGQHVVSRVLLREFCRPQVGSKPTELSSLALQWGKVNPRTPGAVGKVENFVKIDSEATERLWQTVENDLPSAIASAKAGTIFGSPGQVMTIKRAIALHFARGQEVSEFNEQIWRDGLAEGRESMRNHPRLMRAALESRYGPILLPDGKEAAEIALDILMEGTKQLVESGTIFRLRVEDEFERVQKMATGMGLQITVASQGEFLIGDTPVILVGSDGRFGLRNVGLGNAITIALPIGRTHLAALGPLNEQVVASKVEVDEWNCRQIKQARSHVYFHPDSNLEGFAVKVRPPAGTI